jgi:hypothetical protein
MHHDVRVISPPDAASAAAFSAYHRARRRRRTPGMLAGAGVAAAAILALGVVVAAAPAPSPARALASATVPRTSTPAPTATPTTLAADPTADVAPVADAVPGPPLPAVLPGYTIHVTATGYQAELDECQWVRMDLGASAPIVGAHTRCGGAIVLGMVDGDRVDLTGQGLDGDYRVVGARDARAGDPAVAALAGLPGTLVLQTCYPAGDGRVRLVALAPEA